MKNNLFIISALLMLGCSHPVAVKQKPVQSPTHNLEKQLSITLSPPSSIEWYHNLDKAAIASATTHKPMMIFFHSRYCGWCKKMQRETFTNPVIIDKVSSSFVSLTVDMRDDLAKELEIEATPTIVVISISEQGKVSNLGNVVGFIEHEDLLKFFNECLEKVSK